MTLLITFIAAIVITIIWYSSPKAREMQIGIMCYMFWGASLMWLCDAAFGYIEDGAAYFTPATSDMINDSFLGLSVTVLGLLIWVCVLLVKDPKGVVRTALRKESR